jgi:mono/diheme cytochrome c family protein
MRLLKLGYILSMSALFFAGCGEAPKNAVNTATTAPSNTVKVNSAAQPAATIDELAAAREIYTTSCSNCHKEDGAGGKVNIEGTIIDADNLTTEKMKKMSDAKYFDYIKNGVPDEGMPAFKDRLSDDQIKDVVKFIRREFQKQ